MAAAAKQPLLHKYPHLFDRNNNSNSNNNKVFNNHNNNRHSKGQLLKIDMQAILSLPHKEQEVLDGQDSLVQDCRIYQDCS
jgi:hypothetical protein